MKKYFREYELTLSSMRCLKRFMEYCNETIKNKKDLTKMNNYYNEFVKLDVYTKKDMKSFKHYLMSVNAF